MKKLNYLFITLLTITAMAFTSCDDDAETLPPTITVTPNVNNDYKLGNEVTYNIVVGSNEKLKTFTVNATPAGADGTGVVSTLPANVLTNGEFEKNTNAATITYKYVIPSNLAANADVKIEFSVSDKGSVPATKTESFKVKEAVTKYTAVLMGAQQNGKEGSYLEVSTKTVMKMADAAQNSEKVDIIFYYGSTNEATLVAPSDVTVDGTTDGSLDLAKNLTVKNETKLKKSELTSEQFDAINSDAKLKAITGLNGTIVNKLAVNDVIEFETAKGVKGLIKVVKVEAGTNGSITLDIIIPNNAKPAA